MLLNNDYGGYLITVAATIALSFWEELHHFGAVIVILSGLFGLILAIARMIYFINSEYNGSLSDFIANGFKLKRKSTKKRK